MCVCIAHTSALLLLYVVTLTSITTSCSAPQSLPAESPPEDEPSGDATQDPGPGSIASGPGTRTNGTHGTLEEYNATFCFDKVLTSSDAGGHGRVVIPKVR